MIIIIQYCASPFWSIPDSEYQHICILWQLIHHHCMCQNMTCPDHYFAHKSMHWPICLQDLVYELINHLDDLIQDCSISIANALGILQSCTKLSICVMDPWSWFHNSSSWVDSICFRIYTRPVPKWSLTSILTHPDGIWQRDVSIYQRMALCKTVGLWSNIKMLSYQ